LTAQCSTHSDILSLGVFLGRLISHGFAALDDEKHKQQDTDPCDHSQDCKIIAHEDSSCRTPFSFSPSMACLKWARGFMRRPEGSAPLDQGGNPRWNVAAID
jgi:hypothetical protein